MTPMSQVMMSEPSFRMWVNQGMSGSALGLVESFKDLASEIIRHQRSCVISVLKDGVLSEESYRLKELYQAVSKLHIRKSEVTQVDLYILPDNGSLETVRVARHVPISGEGANDFNEGFLRSLTDGDLELLLVIPSGELDDEDTIVQILREYKSSEALFWTLVILSGLMVSYILLNL